MKNLKRILEVKKISYKYSYDVLPYDKPMVKERVCFQLKDNIDISIIKGYGTYSNNTTYEIAIFKDGNFTNEFFTYKDDNVMGYTNIGTILKIMRKFKK